ncbi:MAG: NAD(P)-dependent oxidoreductase [Candidatus Tectomicrobia bacterium]|uniref:NAD(P)-dependent oxidoreductase n=1 Tax=Tectimicrobiota bacterium TaxID=2528274 RepID=A0A938AZ63_UNCTE|nr:NAD(P)-dependent oxidoreductase [Candidatus Tectomicrobia bacterium]
MRVLVTGASGGLAPFVIRALGEQHEVVLMSRRPPHPDFAALPWIQGNMTVFDDCRRAVQGVTAIQHLAAQPWPVDHPRLRAQAVAQGLPFDATFQSNMLGVYYLMQAAVDAGVQRVIMAGSNCALGHGYRISQTPFPLQALPIDESHPALPEDSYSYSKLAGEMLLASYTRAYGIRTYVTRPAAIYSPARRQQIAQQATPATAWNPWLWAWVGSEDVAHAHQLLMEGPATLPLHDVYYLTADDTTALEPSAELIARWQPTLLPYTDGLCGYQSFFSTRKLAQAVGWQHHSSWRALR